MLYALHDVVGLVALEGLSGFSFLFYPFCAYNKEYHHGLPAPCLFFFFSLLFSSVAMLELAGTGMLIECVPLLIECVPLVKMCSIT